MVSERHQQLLRHVRLEEALHVAVDPGAIGVHLAHGRAGDVSALVARMARAGLDVVRVEQEGVPGIEGLVPGEVGPEQEGLEEPGDVGQVPLGGADVLHRLHHAVLGRERLGEGLGAGADIPVAGGECGGVCH